MGALIDVMNPAEAARLHILNGHVDAAHDRVMNEPHWQLLFLAAAPEAQGLGLGSRLLRHTLAIFLNSTLGHPPRQLAHLVS